MFRYNPNLSTYLSDFYNTYGNQIDALATKIFNDEDIKERSCRTHLLYQYYFAFDLSLMIKMELDRGINTDEDYYEAKYSIADKSKKFACNGISLSTIFTLLDITFTTTISKDLYPFVLGQSCDSIFTCETN